VAMLLSNPLAPDPRVDKEARALAGAGYEVTVYAWDRACAHASSEARDGYQIQRVRVPSTYGRGAAQIPGLLRYGWRVWERLRHDRPDVVHCHDLDTLPIGHRISRRLGCRLVFDAHETRYFADARRLRGLLMTTGRALERRLVPRCDLVVVTNDHQIRKYQRTTKRPPVLVANYPEMGPDAPPSCHRTEHHGQALRVGRMGAVLENLGIEETTSAIRSLRADGLDIQYLVAGAGVEDYVGVVRDLAAAHREWFTYTGAYEPAELPALYSRVDVTVTAWTARSVFVQHNTPTKFFESLMYSVPVITTDIGGVGERIQEAECGILLPDAESETITEALRAVFADRQMLVAMGRRGRETVAARWNWNVSATNLVVAYEDLAAVPSVEAAGVGAAVGDGR